MARGFLDDKIKLTWNMQRVLLPKNRVKLLLNMLVIAVGTIPRGGTLIAKACNVAVSLTVEGDGVVVATKEPEVQAAS
jgi:histidine phosphotransferase ChpT